MMNKSIRKSNLAKVVLASLFAMNIYGTAFAAPSGGFWGDDDVTNTRGRVEHVEYDSTTDATTGLKDPNIIHPDMNDHTSQCGEYLHDTDVTVGDLNKVVDDLVSNDQKLNNDIKTEASARENADNNLSQQIATETSNRQNNDIVSGQVNGDTLQLVKGDNTTIDIDVTGLGGGIKEDTYVTNGTYDGDSQTITLERNNGKEDINIQLDNVAKATDVEDLGDRVTTNETNISNIQGNVVDLTSRVETNETNISNIQNDVTDIQGDVVDLTSRVEDNESKITSNSVRIDALEGETIKGGSFVDNTITLEKENGNNIVLEGVASVTDVQNEADAREQKDKELEAAITQETADRKVADDKLQAAIEGEAAIREDADSKLEAAITQETSDRKVADDKLQAAIEGEAAIREEADSKLEAAITQETSDRKVADDKLQAAIEGEAAIREEADSKLEAAITQETSDRKVADDKLQAAIEGEAVLREEADKVLAGEDISNGRMEGNTLVLEKNNQGTIEVDGIASTGDINNLQDQVTNNRTDIDKNTVNIENNKQAIANETSERKAEDARLDGRIDGLQQDVSDLNGRVNRLDGKINKTGALAIAHASLKPLDYDPEYKWSGAMGVGNYHGENAIAAGVFYQPNRDVMLNFSISACGNEKGVGAGVSVRFK